MQVSAYLDWNDECFVDKVGCDLLLIPNLAKLNKYIETIANMRENENPENTEKSENQTPF